MNVHNLSARKTPANTKITQLRTASSLSQRPRLNEDLGAVGVALTRKIAIDWPNQNQQNRIYHHREKSILVTANVSQNCNQGNRCCRRM